MENTWKEEAMQVAENIAETAKLAVHGQGKDATAAAVMTGVEVVLDTISGITTGKPANEEM